MTTSPGQRDHAPLIAIFGAVFLMAHFMSGKIVRDSFFLLNFDAQRLPQLKLAATVTSILVVLLWTRKLVSRSPAVLLPWAILGGCVVQFIFWALYGIHARWSAILFYLFFYGPNMVINSAYWSLLSERFDPRQAKRLFARIAAGGTLGLLAGGAITPFISARFGEPSLLAFLGILHLAAFFFVRKLCGSIPAGSSSKPQTAPAFSEGMRVLRASPYLLTLAAIVFLVMMSENLLEFVFLKGVKAQLGEDQSPVGFLAIFQTGVGLVTFVVQTFLGQLALERLGLARSLMTVPVSYFTGVLASSLLSGVSGLVGLFGPESVLRKSIFRSAYEVSYAPLTSRERRTTKTYIDVGADRLGEAAGASLIEILKPIGMAGNAGVIVGIGCTISAVAGYLMYRLGRLYVKTLESSLIARAKEVSEDRDELPNWSAESMVVGTLSDIRLPGAQHLNPDESQPIRQVPTEELAPARPLTTKRSASPAEKSIASPHTSADPVLERIAALRSTDYSRVREALLDKRGVEPAVVPFLIRLLAWDEVSELVIRVLRKANCSIEGQLADALLDGNEDFAIRRRIPRVLSARPCQISAEALIQGLRDQRFEVRFRCGRALAAITALDAGIFIDRERILRSVEREFFVSKTVWSSYRLLERVEDSDEAPYFDEVLKDRTNKGLEHVFTLLSLVLPREALQIAFKGLHTNDPHLRGTALEYLESILPPNIRERLWPFLDYSAPEPGMGGGPRRSREEILEDLRRSNQSIILNLEELRQKHGDSGSGPR